MLDLRVLGTPDLLDDEGRSLTAVLRQPKRLALLTYLAVGAHRGFCRRDTVLALLWPESDQQRARGALRQATYHLRRALGHDVVVGRGDDDLGVDPMRLRCDAVEFGRLLDEGRRAEALDRYQGPLLPGLHVPDAPAFERWLDEVRQRLQGRAVRAASELTESALAAGRREEAAGWAVRLSELAPEDEAALRTAMGALEDAGYREEALRLYRGWVRRMAEELDDEPGAETVALARLLEERARTAPSANPPARPAPAAPPASPSPTPIPPVVPLPAAVEGVAVPSPGSRRRRAWVGAAILAGLVTVGAWLATTRAGPPAPARVAVTLVQGHGVEDDPGLAAMVHDMMTVSLARIPGLDVLSRTRLYELARVLRVDPATAPGLAEAARHAGAAEVIEGGLYRLPDGRLRLELSRIDARRGRVVGALRVEGANPFNVVDAATTAFAHQLRLPAPQTGIADVTTSSLVAYRLYEEGLQAHYAGDRRSAGRLFLAALAEDSLFAMASYFASMTVPDRHRALLERAARLSERSSDRERLVIRAAWTAAMDDPARAAVADTLRIRYPTEPDGHLWAGRARIAEGRFLEALPPLRQVLVMDSLSLQGVDAHCRACEALSELTTAYLYADSLVAARRVAQEWIRMQPTSAEPWASLFFVLEAQGRLDEALGALDSAAARQPAHWVLGMRGGVHLRRGDFGLADRAAVERMQNGDRASQEEALWALVLSLRHQGRLREALETARRYRWLGAEAGTHPGATLHRALVEVPVLHELGRYAEAAALADSIAGSSFVPGSTSRNGRARAWALTHAATSVAASGDTARLHSLVGEVREAGSRSGYARDRRLHHHVMGLLFQLRGNHEAAATEFRHALYSVRGGYSRTNLELGRSLLALGRARDAVPVLEAAVNGPVGADGFFTTRTELRGVLAEALASAGEVRRAQDERVWVARALEGADRAAGPRSLDPSRALPASPGGPDLPRLDP